MLSKVVVEVGPPTKCATIQPRRDDRYCYEVLTKKRGIGYGFRLASDTPDSTPIPGTPACALVASQELTDKVRRELNKFKPEQQDAISSRGKGMSMRREKQSARACAHREWG